MKWKALALAGMTTLVQSAYGSEQAFSATINLYPAISVTQLNPLRFKNVAAGKLTKVITEPESNHAIVFKATGEPFAYINARVIEEKVTLINGSGHRVNDRIIVDSFSTGGNLSNSGMGAFNAQGNLENLRIGATAHVTADNLPGDYASVATFRLTYI